MNQAKAATNVAKANGSKAATSKAAAKQTDKAAVKSSEKLTGRAAAVKMAEAARKSEKVIIYLADGVTSGMIQRSLQEINKLHKLDAGGYMYCLRRWLKFADAVNFFGQFKNITAEEISKLPNLAEFRTDYEKKQFEKSGKYSVWLIGQLVKRYAADKSKKS